MIRVLLADDEALVRTGLRLLLQTAPGVGKLGGGRDDEVASAGLLVREHRRDQKRPAAHRS